MIYTSAPQQLDAQVRGVIQYVALQHRWVCAQCKQWASINVKANIVQLALKTHRDTQAAWDKFRKPNTEEQWPITARLCALWAFGYTQKNGREIISQETRIHRTRISKNYTFFWRRIGYASWRKAENKWKCQLTDCAHRRTNIHWHTKMNNHKSNTDTKTHLRLPLLTLHIMKNSQTAVLRWYCNKYRH